MNAVMCYVKLLHADGRLQISSNEAGACSSDMQACKTCSCNVLVTFARDRFISCYSIDVMAVYVGVRGHAYSFARHGSKATEGVSRVRRIQQLYRGGGQATISPPQTSLADQFRVLLWIGNV